MYLYGFEKEGQKIFLDGREVTGEIPNTGSILCCFMCQYYTKVRHKLVELQREIAKKVSLVMDGRDIGTYVMPDATLKIFLTATPEERAKRRWRELKEKELMWTTILY